MSAACPVQSYYEWDLLDEVDRAMFPSWYTIEKHTMPPGGWEEIGHLSTTCTRLCRSIGENIAYVPYMLRLSRKA